VKAWVAGVYPAAVPIPNPEAPSTAQGVMQRAEMVLGLGQDDRTIVFGQTDVLKRTDAVASLKSYNDDIMLNSFRLAILI
jgi:hypothetical protein